MAYRLEQSARESGTHHGRDEKKGERLVAAESIDSPCTIGVTTVAEMAVFARCAGTTMKKLIEKLKYILVVPGTFDPDDLRRRQVLNSILLFIVSITLVMVIAEFWDDSPAWLVQQCHGCNDLFMAFVAEVAGIAFVIILLLLNRSSRMPRDLVGWIFVVGVLVISSFSDYPLELTSGRTIFIWAIPVALSVIVLPPASVAVVDLIITIAFFYYAGFQWHDFEIYTLTEIYIVSFISWIGMSVANQALRDARNEAKKNSAILEGVAEGVIVLGSSDQIILANQAASELLGNDITRLTPLVESAQIAGRALSFRWSRVEGVGWVAIVRDISRQIEIDHAKDAILRVVSHEMRTPLAAILGFAEVLETRPVPGLATRIRANGQRLLKLVNDLLDVAQIQAGALTMHTESFSPALLASYVEENFRRAAEEKGVVLEVRLSPALPQQVTGDIQRLEQVVSNLAGNALKFTEKGGKVKISFCAEEKTKWQIVVKDSGIGIPPERLSDIFEPFRRASDYAKRKHQGIGLGLSIAKKIVQLSGGNISVESTVGKGSTFTVTLPSEHEWDLSLTKQNPAI